MGRRGQMWSMDLVIGVLIFMLAVGVIYTLLMSRSRDDIAPLRIESKVIATKLSDDPTLKIADNNRIDTIKLNAIMDMSYDQLKTQFGVKDDFCIYLRDENGNLTYFIDNKGNAWAGIGPRNGQLNLSGTPCGCKPGNNVANCTT